MAHSQFQYPDSPRIDHVDLLHGTRVPDPYRWLEDVDSVQTRNWIAAQNQLTSEYLAQIPARERIRQRLTELWNYERCGVPVKRGTRYFFTMNDGLQNQDVLVWTESLDGEPSELLDPNGLSEDGTVALIDYHISHDGKLLAYGLSSAGSDWQEWAIREVDSGRDLDDRLQWIKFTLAAWSPDNSGFYYSGFDEPAADAVYKGANYYQKLYYHRIGSSQASDTVVYARPDHKDWRFLGELSEDGRFLIITVTYGTHRETAVFYQDLHADDPTVVELLEAFDAGYYFLGNDGTLFYFWTDLDAPMGRVIGIDIARPERASWRTIVPEATDAMQDISFIGGLFVTTYLHNAYSKIKILDKTGILVHEIELPTLGTVTGLHGREDDTETFYQFTGFTTPGTVYHLDLHTGHSTIFHEPALSFDPSGFVTRQVFYQSKDGTRIPMFITHKRELEIDGDTPTYLYGYGGYNIAQTPAFSVPNLVWMEMGGVHALANLRGGGEYGKAWHEAGMKLKRQNVFTDFIAAAEWLIENGYTNTARLAIGGRSNGGLLVGACLTQRPDLYGTCLPVVGVMDMLRFHKFTVGWGWVSDYGSPEDPEEFKALLAYSPYHNVRPRTAYPPTLIATGDHDDRVFPAHSYKFAAALQAAQAGSAPVLIRIDSRSGHKLGKPTYKLIDEWADLWAFALDNLGIDGSVFSAVSRLEAGK